MAVGPQIGAAFVGGQGQIVVEADRHAGRASLFLRSLQLQIDLPLQPLVEQDATPVGVGKFADRQGVGRTIGLRPVRPDPDFAVLRVQHLIQGTINRKAFQQFPLLAAPKIKTARPAGASPPLLPQKTPEQQAENAELHASDLFVTHLVAGAQSRQLRLEPLALGDALSGRAESKILDGLDIEVNGVAGECRQRKIGAGVVGLAVVQGVQRVQADERHAERGSRPACEAAQVGEIADPPVARGTNPEQADGQAGQLAVVVQSLRKPGPIRSHDQPAMRGPRQPGHALHDCLDFVVAQLGDARQRQTQGQIALLGDETGFDRSQAGKRVSARVQAAVFQTQGDRDTSAGHQSVGHVEPDGGHALGHRDNQDRRQSTGPAAGGKRLRGQPQTMGARGIEP